MEMELTNEHITTDTINKVSNLHIKNVGFESHWTDDFFFSTSDSE